MSHEPRNLADETVVAALKAALGDLKPKVLITLGSGLGALADEIVDPIDIPFTSVNLPDTTVEGHSGSFRAGTLNGEPVLVQRGRIHLYEGQPIDKVVAAVRAAAGLGIDTFIVTNAAGGINDTLAPGDLMVINDHINFTGMHPSIGHLPPVFVDMSDAYTLALRESFVAHAKAEGQHVQQGVYIGFTGPSYETPAEIEMCRRWGGHAVGMSTVNEVIAAVDAGMKVFGCSLITNVHKVGGTPTNHQEVIDAGAIAGPRLASLLATWLPKIF